MRHDLVRAPELGDKVYRCLICGAQWDGDTMSSIQLTGLEYLECPGAPHVIRGGDQRLVVDGRAVDDDFMPDNPQMREQYVQDQASPALRMFSPAWRKQRIRALLAELAELLTDDGE